MPPFAADLAVRLDPGSLLLEAARRADEAALIAAEVPDAAATFALVAAPPEPPDGPERIGPDAVDDVSRVAALLDGRRDVAAVADATGLSAHVVGRALFTLVRAGRAFRVAPTAASSAESPRFTDRRADEHLTLGIAFARSGMLDEALRELRRVLELRPADLSARAHLGATALRAGRVDEAAAALSEAVSMPGVTAATVHAYGVTLHQLGQLDLAESAYDRAGRLGLADDARHLTARAALALDRRDWNTARDLLERARAASPQPTAAWYHHAILAALGVRDAARAAALAREGVAAYPRAAVLLANAAAMRAAAARGRDDPDALHGVMSAIAERPDLAPAHRLFGELLYRAGQFDRACDAYAAATRLAPRASATAWARLGTLALRAGDRESARQAWEQACSLQPDHPTARANLEALGRSGADAPPAP